MEPLDLSDDGAATSRMPGDSSWRIRAVEEILLDSADSCVRKRSLRCAPLRELLDLENTDTEETVLIGLPFSTVERGPLMDFDIEGPLGDAWPLPRVEIARRQCHYLLDLARQADATVQPGAAKSARGTWVKRNTSTGRFLDAKSSGGSFKGVRKEK